jgi:hypothetical protein
MAPVVSQIDRDADLTVRTVTGDVTARQLLDALATSRHGEPTRFVLWDFREAQLERLTASEVRGLAQATERYAAGRAGGKTALVFSSDFAYGLGRLFDQTRNVSGAPVDYMSFRDQAAALAWLAAE